MDKKFLEQWRTAALSHNTSAWRLAAGIAIKCYPAKQGRQPKRSDHKITAKEFAREVDMPGWSYATVNRWLRAWELAADATLVPHAESLKVSTSISDVLNHGTPKGSFEEYLSLVITAQGARDDEPEVESEPDKSGFLSDEEADDRAEDALDQTYDPIHWERTIQRLEKGLSGLEDWWLEHGEQFQAGELRDNMGGEQEAVQRVIEATERAAVIGNVFKEVVVVKAEPVTAAPNPTASKKVSKRVKGGVEIDVNEAMKRPGLGWEG